jgi:hypothetical protein
VLPLGSAQCSKTIADGLMNMALSHTKKKRRKKKEREKKVMGNMNKTMSPT